jgi:hypothetical protein
MTGRICPRIAPLNLDRTGRRKGTSGQEAWYRVGGHNLDCSYQDCGIDVPLLTRLNMTVSAAELRESSHATRDIISRTKFWYACGAHCHHRDTGRAADPDGKDDNIPACFSSLGPRGDSTFRKVSENAVKILFPSQERLAQFPAPQPPARMNVRCAKVSKPIVSEPLSSPSIELPDVAAPMRGQAAQPRSSASHQEIAIDLL